MKNHEKPWKTLGKHLKPFTAPKNLEEPLTNLKTL
jgi:hypothetical protein